MENSEKHIDKLFSNKFETFEATSSDNNWSMLEPRLSKLNFLKFSLLTFNIYYLLVIFSFAGTSVYSVVKTIQLSTEVKQLNETIKTLQVKENKQNSSLKQSDPAESKFSQKSTPLVISKKADNPLLKQDNPTHTTIPKTQPVSDPTTSHKLEQHNLVQYDDKKTTNGISKSDSVSKTSVSSRMVDTTSKSSVKRVKKTIIVKPVSVIIKDTIVVNKSHKKTSK